MGGYEAGDVGIFYDWRLGVLSLIVALVVALLAVTTRLRIRHAMLNASLQRLRVVAEANPSIVWTADLAGNLLFGNAALLEYAGVTLDELSANGWHGLVHHSDRAALNGIFERSDPDDGTVVEIRLRRADGAYRWHTLRARRLRDKAQARGGVRWVGSCADVHDRNFAASMTSFLAEASELLTASLELDRLLHSVAELACRYADSCVIELRGDAGTRIISSSSEILLDSQLSTLEIPLRAGERVLGRLLCSRGVRAFNEGERALFDHLATRISSAIVNAQSYQREHHLAETLQKEFLPVNLPTLEGIDFDVLYAVGGPESDVGGDWYDAFELPDGRVAISIGDIAGHGVRSAATMGRVRHALRDFALDSTEPGDVLERVQRVLMLEDRSTMATAIFGYIDPVAGVLTYANAGHPDPLLASDGAVIALPGGGLPIGLTGNERWKTYTAPLPESGLLLLYTDGLVEQHRDIVAAQERVKAAMLEVAADPGIRAAQYVKDALFEEAPRDDVAILAMRLIHPTEQRIALSISAVPASASAVRGALKRFAGRLKLDDDATFRLQVAVGEAINNAIEHAYGARMGTIEIRVWCDEQTIHAEISDSGSWRVPRERDEGRGRGMTIIHELADDVNIERRGNTTNVVLQFATDRP